VTPRKPTKQQNRGYYYVGHAGSLTTMPTTTGLPKEEVALDVGVSCTK